MIAVGMSVRETDGQSVYNYLVWSRCQLGVWNTAQLTLNPPPPPMPNWSISKAWGQGCAESFDHGDHTGVDMSLPECFCSGCSWQEDWAILKPLSVCLSVSCFNLPAAPHTWMWTLITWQLLHSSNTPTQTHSRINAHTLLQKQRRRHLAGILFVLCGSPPVIS